MAQLLLLGLMTLSAAPAAAPPVFNTSTLIPQPQCIELLQEGGANPATVPIDSSWVIVAAAAAGGGSELDFAISWLQRNLSSGAAPLHLKRVATPPPPSGGRFIYLGVPAGDPTLAALLREQKLSLNTTRLGREGYVLSTVTRGVLLAAPQQAGVFYAVQTLLQLASGPGRLLPTSVLIEDWPDSPDRGVYMYGSDYDNPGWNRAEHRSGQAFIDSVLDEMATLKLNFGLFDADGFLHFWHAMMNEDESGQPTAPGAFTANLTRYKTRMGERHIEMVPQLAAASGGPAEIDADVGDGLYVKDEPFVIGAKEVTPARPVMTTLPPNGNFTQVDERN